MNKDTKQSRLNREYNQREFGIFTGDYGSIIDLYLSNAIGEASEYIDCFNRIRNARETDVVRIHINCPGGNLFTTIQFMQALSECNAPVIMIVEGACMSAATLLFLMGDEFVVNEHSVFLFHNYSGGMMGKGGEMYHGMVHERKWTERLLRSSYEDFLTEEEITNLLEDKDVWMDAETVISRLQSRGEKIVEKEEKKDSKLKASQKANDRKSKRGTSKRVKVKP